MCNFDVRAQYIALRLLKAGREDLQVSVDVNFTGIQLEAGDIVSLTNANYGWTNKLFRVNQISETFTDDGQVIAKLRLAEFNPTVYDDQSITEFTPSPNTGISSPLTFGIIPAPVVSNQYPLAANPLFQVEVTASSAGIIQYAEVWYSAYANPTSTQRIFAGTTAIESNGDPYAPEQSLALLTWQTFRKATGTFSPEWSMLLAQACIAVQAHCSNGGRKHSNTLVVIL